MTAAALDDPEALVGHHVEKRLAELGYPGISTGNNPCEASPPIPSTGLLRDGVTEREDHLATG